MQPGVVPGAVFEFHAARAALGLTPGINSPLTTQAFDTSNNGNHGTLIGAAGSVASGYAGAGTLAAPSRLVLDGVDDYVSVPDAASLRLGTADFTIEIEVKSPFVNNAPSNGGLFSKGCGTTPAIGGWGLKAVGTTTNQLAFVDVSSAGAYNANLSFPNLAAGSHRIGVVRASGVYYRYYDGTPYSTPVTPANVANLTISDPLILGRLRIATTQYLGTEVPLARIYPFALSAAQMASNEAAGTYWPTIDEQLQALPALVTAILAKVNTLPAAPAAVGSAMTLTPDYDRTASAPGLLIIDGDSWASQATYPNAVFAAITPTPDTVNLGVGGQSWAGLLSDAATQVDSYHSASRAYNIVVAISGVNDYHSGSLASAKLPNMVAYCQGRRDAGFKVIVGSCGPDKLVDVAASYDAQRAIHNAYLRDHWPEFADGYADFTADTYIGGDNSPNDQPSSWSNGAHPSASGYGILAGYVTSAVNAIITATQAGAAVVLTSDYDRAKDDVLTPLEAVQDAADAVLLKTNTLGGAGAIEWTYTLTTDYGTPIPDADVWVTTDESGNSVVASGRTNANGVITFYLDAGTVYVWSQKTGYNFTNPDLEVVS